MPARLPETVKKERGTARKSRELSAPSVTRLTKAPAPPATLTPPARLEWVNLAGILVQGRTLSGADLRALELLCETLASATEFAEIVRREGATVAAGSGGTKGHPALQALATARAQARTLLADFGLTPRGRQGVGEAPPDPKARPWSDRFFKD